MLFTSNSFFSHNDWLIKWCFTLLSTVVQSYPGNSSPYSCQALHLKSVAYRTWEWVWRSLVRSMARPIFFPRINDSHCNRIYSSLTAVRCFDNGYMGKLLVAWKEYSAEYSWLNEFQESLDSCIGRCAMTEILLEKALNTFQSINQLLYLCLSWLSPVLGWVFSHNDDLFVCILTLKPF